MKTKNYLLLIALISSIFYHSTSFGQGKEKKPHQPNSRKVEELRDQFYKEKLALSPEEESKFWPLFHEHQHTMQKLRKNIKEKKEKSFHQAPEEKAGPSAASTMTRTALSVAALSSVMVSDAIIASERLLRVAASDSVKRSTPPARADSRRPLILPRCRVA